MKPDLATLTPPQAEILEAGLLDSGFNCVLQMPTGSGKTWLARRTIGQTIQQGYRAIYLCPTRALASELYATWQRDFEGRRVGIFTGDFGTSARPYPVDFDEADVLLMTPERFDACTRHWRSHWRWLPEVDLLVVDEFHLLGDGLRGARLEGALSRFRRLNPFARVVGLSATLGNREELADWLDGIEYQSTWRPVPLEWKNARFRKADEKPAILAREVARAVKAGGRSLVFVQSRRRAEFVADFLRASDLRADHHHAGLDHNERAVVEGRFRSGDLDVLVCTATLEVGLNLPARQVVLYDLQEFDGSDFKPLKTTSVWQRVGRAGRYGLDPHGEAVLIAPTWDKACDRYPKGAFEPIRSQLSDPTWLAEQILVELTSGLARNRSELRSVLSESLACAQGRLPDIDRCVAEMIEAQMLREDDRAPDDEREIRLRATRIGRIAVRHMLKPRTMLTLRAVLETIEAPTFFDLALVVAATEDCEPVLPCDFEDLELLSTALSDVRSQLLGRGFTELREITGTSQKRLLAALKMAAIAIASTKTQDVAEVASDLNCYPYEVRRLIESIARLLGATVDLLEPVKAQGAELTAPENPPPPLAQKRAALLCAMISQSLDADTASLTLVRGIGAVWARRLAGHGIGDVEELAQASVEDLVSIKGLSSKRAQEWIEKAERVIKDEDVWTTLDFGPAQVIETSAQNWPRGLDPYRLRRALQLQVAQEAEHFRITGGLDPHLVQRTPAGWQCDCADHAKGSLCKHVLAARLSVRDETVTAARDALFSARHDDTFNLASLWLAEEPRHVHHVPESAGTHTPYTQRRHRVSCLHTGDHVRQEVPA